MTDVPKRRGRPPLDPRSPEPSTEVCVTVSAADYGQAVARAKAARVSVQTYIRYGLRRLLRDALRTK